VGGLLEVTYHGSATTNAFVAYDGNGNVAALVNAADGTLLANYEYGPFGELIRATGPMAKLNPAREGTKFYDDETDMAYYGYRYYNPSTGRWPNRDPIGEPGFELVANRPKVDAQTPKTKALANLEKLIKTVSPGLLENFKSQIAQMNLPSEAIQANQNTVNLYVFVGNDPIIDIDGFGLDCSSAPPVPNSCSACDAYGNETYPFFGVSLKCFCECAGNSPWSQKVRGCLLCEHAKGTEVTKAHIECYLAAGLKSAPWATLKYCYYHCGGIAPPPPIIAGMTP